MKVVSDVRLMSIAAMAGVFFIAARSILILRLVEPDVVGVWKSVMVLYVFAEVLRFGVQRGLSARLPILLGEGNEAEADRITLGVTSFAFYSSLLMAAVCVGFSVLSNHEDYKLGFLLMAGVLFVAQFHILIREVTVARHRFRFRALDTIINCGIDFFAVLGLGALYGLKGIGLGTFCAITIPAAFLFLANKQPIRLRPAWGIWKDLAREGFRFSIADALFSWLRFSDVAMMSWLGGSHFVGLYALCQLSHDFSMYIILAAVGQVVTPHLMRVYGETGCLASAARVMEAPLDWLSLLLPPLLGLASIVAPPMVEWLLPHYAGGLPALQYSLWSVFFLSLHAAQVAFFQASGQFLRLMTIFAILAPISALAQLVSWRMGFGLEGAALTGASILFTAAASEHWLIRRILGDSHLETFVRFLRLNVPFFACFAACQLLDRPEWILLALTATPLLAYRFFPLRIKLEIVP